MTRKSHSSLAHAALIGRYLHKQTHWEMRRPLTTSLEAEGATSLPLDELAFLGVVIILCAIWRRKKSSRPTHCRRVKLYNQTSVSKNSKPYMARQKVLMFKKISEDIISCIQSMSGYIFKAEYFNGSRQVNISWFHLLLSGDVELNPGPYTGEDADVKETLLTTCDKLLTMEDWDAVVSAVEPLTAQWNQLGRKLGIRHDTLDIIASGKDTPSVCLEKTIAEWLDLNYITDRYNRPSWRSLAEAVVGLNKRLFLKIASDHAVKDEESITIEKEQSNLSNQAMTSAETVQPKSLLHENTDDKSAKFPWEFIPALTYPGLQLKENFSKEQSEKYEVKLEQHSQEMIATFNDLMFDLQECMISKNVSISKLKTFLRGLHRLSTIDETDQLTICKNLMKAQTIDDMMLIIWSYCSFFNFSLIEKMVYKFKQLHDFKPRLEQYKEAFARYAECKLVYCCPSGIGLNTKAGLGAEATEIVVKLDDAYKDCRLTYLETLRKDLCQIFRIPLEIFPLEGVQPGSVCVVFQAPEFMKKEIFPLSEKQILALRELNYDKIQIYSVVCSEYSYDIREKQSYAGSDSGIGTFHSKVYPESDLGSDSGLDASYFVTKTMGLEYIKNMKDKFLQMSDKAIQLSTLSEMHMKAIEGDLESIVEMIENETTDYNPMNRDVRGNTALHYAAGNGHLHVIKYFVEELGFNCTIEGRDGITPLHYAASMGHRPIVEYLLDFQQVEALCHDKFNCTPLHYACREGHIGVVKQLADNIEQYLGEMQECNSSCLDKENITPLHLAAVGGHLSVIEYLVKDKECDSMCKNIYGNTPLHVAASYGHLEVIKFLIKSLNGEPETLDKFGNNALHAAARNGQLNIVEHLIENEGYNPSCVNDFHYTPLHIALKSKQPLPIFKYLILGKECDPLCRDRNGNTPLHFAAVVGHMEVVQFLISNMNCPTEAYNVIGQSPLHAAAIGGHLNIVQLLIEKEGFNPSSSDVLSSTPLHYAAKNGHLSVVEYLSLYLKYNPSCKDIAVHYPLQPHHIELAISKLKLEYERYKIQSTYKASEKIVSLLSLIDKVGWESIVNSIPEALTSNTLNVLQTAVFSGHLNVVKHLIIKEGHDPSCLDEDNDTLLHIAARVGHLSIVEYLTLEKVCDPMSRDRNGNTPLHRAALSGHLEVVKFFIENLNNKPETLNKFGHSALHTAAMGGQLNVVEHLIEKEGYNPFCVDYFHHTPLHTAAMGRQPLPIFKYLILGKECDPLCRDRNGNTPLHLAALFGHMEAVQFLISNMNCPTEAYNIIGQSPLHTAAIGGHLNVVQHLVEKEGFDPSSPDVYIIPLHYAICCGHLPVVEYLLTLNQEPVSKDTIVHTPPHRDHMEVIISNMKNLHETFNEYHSAHHSAKEFNALMQVISFLRKVGLENLISSLKCEPEKILLNSNQNLLVMAVVWRHLNIVKYLIKEGHDPSCLNEHNNTLLHVAAYMGWLSIVEYLTLERICDPMSRDINGNSPLHLAARNGHMEVLQFLISKMDHTQDMLNNDGHNALHVAAISGNLNIVQELIKTGCSLSFLDAYDNTSLHLAAANGHLSVVKYLILDKACNPMCKDIDGNTPLHDAAQYGHMEVLQFLISNMNYTSEILNNDGLNALHVAAMGGNLNIVRYLIEKEGYSPFLKDACDGTPLHYATASGHLETVKYLTNFYSCQDLNLLHNYAKHLPIHSAAFGGNLETIKFLEQFNDLHSLDRDGWSCLHVAAGRGHLEAVRYFIKEHSFYPAIEDNDQVTPLHLASWQGHLEVITYLIFEKECNPLCRDKSQDTPLHWAASEGQLETIKFFIEVLNLSPFIEGEDEQTVLGYAELYGHDKVVEYIISTLE